MRRALMMCVCFCALVALACEGADGGSTDASPDASAMDCGDPEQYWEHIVAEPGFTVTSIAPMGDGGFAVGGWIPSGEETFGYVLRLDPFGALKWARPVIADAVNAVAEVPVGKLIVAGARKSFGSHDGTVTILDPNGNGGLQTGFHTSGGDDWAEAAIGMPDGGGAIAVLTVPNPATFGSQVHIVRYGDAVNLMWSASKTLPNLGPFEGAAMVATEDGGAIAAWTLEKFFPGSGDTQIYVMRTDEDGKILVAEEYGTSAGERVYALASASDGQFVAGGCVAEDGACRDSLLVRFFPYGNTVWEKKFNEENGEPEEIRAILPLAEGGFITASFAQHGSGALQFRRISDDGEVLWTTSAGVKHGVARVALVLGSELVHGAVAETDELGSRVRTFALDPATGAFCD